MIRPIIIAGAVVALSSCALAPRVVYPPATPDNGPWPTQPTLPPDAGQHWDPSDGCEYPLVRSDIDTCVYPEDEPQAVVCIRPYVYSVAGTCVLVLDEEPEAESTWSGEP